MLWRREASWQDCWKRQADRNAAIMSITTTMSTRSAAMGITTMIAVQVAINIGVVTGSIPPTGQTLPFISAGTSSLMLFMGSIGILLNISRYSTPS